MIILKDIYYLNNAFFDILKAAEKEQDSFDFFVNLSLYSKAKVLLFKEMINNSRINLL
jgi:hypothetical protein